MKGNQKILNFEKRRKIYNLILEKPGLHLREIEREMDYSFGALRYHLGYMEKRGLIITIPEKGFLRYYVSNYVGNGDKELLSAFRQPVLRKMFVILLMCADKEVFYTEDFKSLPYMRNWWAADNSVIIKHRTTLEFHLNKLVEIGILEAVKVKRKVGYKFNNYDEIWDFLVRYSDALPYKELKGLLYWANKLIVPNITDRIMEYIYEIFPHPYRI